MKIKFKIKMFIKKSYKSEYIILQINTPTVDYVIIKNKNKTVPSS